MAPVDMTPIAPPPGSPDDPARPLRAPEPAAAVPVSVWTTPAPTITPAEPAAWTRTVPLDHALMVDGVRLDAITMRRPTGGDIAELLENDPTEATLSARVRAFICGLHPAVFAALSVDDSERVAEALVPFLPRAILALEAALAPADASA